MVDKLETKSKFTFIAEILPQNERTRDIMAQREAVEQQRRTEVEEVRNIYIYDWGIIHIDFYSYS